MKWFLCLLLIGTGLFSYKQSQTIGALTAELTESGETVADLKNQLQASVQARNAAVKAASVRSVATPQPAVAVASPSATPTPPSNSWMWQRSILDPNTKKK